MAPKKLEKIRRLLEQLACRKPSIRYGELVAIAKKLGRVRVVRGKHPTYERDAPGWMPLSIPAHPGTLPTGTADSILGQLEEDVDRLAAEMQAELLKVAGGTNGKH